jgi:hypothetical protein
MKKRLTLIFALFAVLVVGTVWAFDPPTGHMNYTTTQTADAAAAVTGAGYLYGISCKTDGSNAVTFQIYDSLTASGTRIVQDYICSTSSANRVCVFGWDPPLPFNTGVSVDITSSDTTPDYVVYYRLR